MAKLSLMMLVMLSPVMVMPMTIVDVLATQSKFEIFEEFVMPKWSKCFFKIDFQPCG